MGFEIPTLPALVLRAESELSGAAESSLRRSDRQVIGRMHAGTAYGLYGFLGYVAQQILPDSCDEEVLGRWASMRDVPRTEAIASRGWIIVRGSAGALVPKGAIFQTGAVQYLVEIETRLVGPSALVPVVAVIAGVAGNMSAGKKLSAVSPILEVVDQAEVGAEGLAGGTDAERLERWRARVIDSFRVVPHGGDADDYTVWAKEVPGVTRAWSIGNYMGPGTVGLFFLRDDDPDPIPRGEAVAAVKAHLETKRPITADVYVLAPAPLVVQYRLKVEPDTPALRARVEGALADLHRSEADLGTRFLWTHIGEAISAVPGETDHKILAPLSVVVPARNELPIFGGVEWV